MVTIKSDDFDTVYSLPNSRKPDLYEGNLLYFIRNLEIKYKVGGKIDLCFSKVVGPYNETPGDEHFDRGTNRIISNKEFELFTKLIPQEIMPLELEKVVLIQGILPNEKYPVPLWVSKGQLGERIKQRKVLQFIEKNYKLKKREDLKKIGGFRYMAFTDDFLINYNPLHFSGPTPITVFGRTEPVEQMLKESGIYRFKMQNPSHKSHAESYLGEYRKEGFAYNLSFDRKTIEELVRGNNVIL